MWLHRISNFIWYKKNPISWLLVPMTSCYRGIVRLRRYYLQAFCQQQFEVPIIVVGNLTVGGVGKTPLVIALAKAFQARGLRVGLVSRGYGASMKSFPHEVQLTDLANEVGDEPLLLAKRTNCPVVIAPKRTDAVQYLLDRYQSQVIISDDGLQHYKMGRAVELVVIDGKRGFGNNRCLPAGPMRETIGRLNEVDFIVVNGGQGKLMDMAWELVYPMNIMPHALMRVVDDQQVAWTEIQEPFAAVAGLGHPERFFETLATLGLAFKPYPFSDHHLFKQQDFLFPEKTTVMTEKDAVKCLSFATQDMYYLPVEAKLDDRFWQSFWAHEKLQGL